MKGGIYEHMRWTLLLGKYTGLMPIVGLEFSREIPRFTWKSISTIIYIINLVILMFAVVICTYSFANTRFDVTKLNGVIYFAVHFIMCTLLFPFCQKFRSFLMDIQAIEKLLPHPWKPRASVRFTNRTTVVFLLLGMGEYLVFIIQILYQIHICFELKEDSGWYKSYILVSFEWYFNYFPFSYVPPIILQVIHFQAGIMWFYGELIVLSASIYLKSRLEDFNRLIIDEKCVFTKNFKPTWSELQVHYTRLSKLVNIFDKHMNPTVFVSYVSNLYSICLELYIILNDITNINKFDSEDCTKKHKSDVIFATFKMYTTCTVLLRTALFSYFVSEVHVASRRSLIALHSIPASACDSDMQRVMNQIYYSKLGVTGLNFFKITRGMILAMVAQLLTYELVVLQF